MGLSIILVKDINALDEYSSDEFEQSTEEIWHSSYSSSFKFRKELQLGNFPISGEWSKDEIKNTIESLKNVQVQSEWKYSLEKLMSGLIKAIDENLHVVSC